MTDLNRNGLRRLPPRPRPEPPKPEPVELLYTDPRRKVERRRRRKGKPQKPPAKPVWMSEAQYQEILREWLL